MFAINHAATGLIIKRIFPEVPMADNPGVRPAHRDPLGLLKLSRVEKTTTENRVKSVSDVHLEYMPFSHSVVSTAALAGAQGYSWPWASGRLM